MFSGGVSQFSIGLINSGLSKMRKDLERLKQALTKLNSTQSEFRSSRPMTEEPILTANTWHGNHASDFEDVRTDKVIVHYDELHQKQLEKAIADVKEAILKLEAEIKRLEAELAVAMSHAAKG